MEIRFGRHLGGAECLSICGRRWTGFGTSTGIKTTSSRQRSSIRRHSTRHMTFSTSQCSLSVRLRGVSVTAFGRGNMTKSEVEKELQRLCKKLGGGWRFEHD